MRTSNRYELRLIDRLIACPITLPTTFPFPHHSGQHPAACDGTHPCSRGGAPLIGGC